MILNPANRLQKAIVSGAMLLLSCASFPVHAQGPEKATAATEQKDNGSITEPKLIVAKFHADWCGSCKAMGPVLTDLENKLDADPVLFVTFDLTNQMTRRQSEMRAAALGLEEIWTENKGGTGKIKVLDADSKKVLATLSKEKSLKEMTAEIRSALEKSE